MDLWLASRLRLDPAAGGVLASIRDAVDSGAGGVGGSSKAEETEETFLPELFLVLLAVALLHGDASPSRRALARRFLDSSFSTSEAAVSRSEVSSAFFAFLPCNSKIV